MKESDRVKFKKPISEFEKTAVYEIVNINTWTNRAQITVLNSNLPIAPTELVSINDIELV